MQKKNGENLLKREEKVLEDFLSDDIVVNFEDLLKNFKNRISQHNIESENLLW